MTNADLILPMQLIDAAGRQVALVVPADEMAKLTGELERLKVEVEEMRRQRDRAREYFRHVLDMYGPPPPTEAEWAAAKADPMRDVPLLDQLRGNS